MYVCVCRGITDSALRAAAARQPDADARRLCRELGVGTDCGRCARAALAIVHQAQDTSGWHPAVRAAGVVQMQPVAG